MQKASDSDVSEALAYCGFCWLRLGGRSPGPFLAPAFAEALTATIGHLLLASVELRALIRGQDVANLRGFLSANTRAGLPCLLYVAAERSGVTLLASGARRVDERLRLVSRGLILRLILLAYGRDLRLLGVGQIEVGEEIATGSSATAELSAGTGAASIRAAVRSVLRRGGRLSSRNSRHANEHQGAY